LSFSTCKVRVAVTSALPVNRNGIDGICRPAARIAMPVCAGTTTGTRTGVVCPAGSHTPAPSARYSTGSTKRSAITVCPRT
jgi:hypothetical protein